MGAKVTDRHVAPCRHGRGGRAVTQSCAVPGIEVGLTLGPIAMLPGDPTIQRGPMSFSRATITPEGPGVIHVTWGREAGHVDVQTERDGGAWLLARAPGFIGAADDASGFTPEDPVVRRLWSRFRGDRVGATGTVWHDLAWIITQQRIHRRDAAAQWRRLVQTFGEPCDEGLLTPPDPDRLARTAPWSLRALGIDERRATALIAAARVAGRLHRLCDDDIDTAAAKLGSLPGVGTWTLACLRAFTWGDPDTVITGDSGIPSLIASTLVGEVRADDARMVELLEPYRPHRYRVLRLALAARTGRRPL